MLPITGEPIFSGIDKHARLNLIKLRVKTTQEQQQKIHATISSQFGKWPYQMSQENVRMKSITKLSKLCKKKKKGNATADKTAYKNHRTLVSKLNKEAK